MQSAAAAAAAAATAALCVAILLFLLQLLLAAAAAAAVRHRVPDGNFCCWFIESDSSVLLFIETRYIFNAPLGSTVAVTVTICLYYILGDCGHARRQGGRQPATLKPDLYHILFTRPHILLKRRRLTGQASTHPFSMVWGQLR